MKLIIDIPKEFEEDFNQDRFEDSLARVASDIESFGFQLAGRYEKETITMLREAFRNCKVLPEHHGRLIDADVYRKELLLEIPNLDYDGSLEPYEEGIYSAIMSLDDAPTIIEGVMQNE